MNEQFIQSTKKLAQTCSLSESTGFSTITRPAHIKLLKISENASLYLLIITNTINKYDMELLLSITLLLLNISSNITLCTSISF